MGQAKATSIQQGFYVYEGYVRLTMGRFAGAIRPAEVMLGLGGGLFPDLIHFDTHGYWHIAFGCDAMALQGGDGSVSASCGGGVAYLKFWTKGLFLDSGLYCGAPATLQFYYPYVRGQFVGALYAYAMP